MKKAMSSPRCLAAVVLLGLVLLGACRGPAPAPTATAAATLDPTSTLHPASTSTPVPTAADTATPTVTLTATWAVQGPGQIVCPILLYHHIAEAPASDSAAARAYYVLPGDFEAQLKALHDWGYTAISASQLAEAILYGAVLPAHPIVISFDDGNLDVYQNAFPRMQAYGFIGVAYIIADALHADGYMDPEQLKELAAAGWEIGSHSMTHSDLRKYPDRLYMESGQSRVLLQDAIGGSVRTFAYPYGLADGAVTRQVQTDGYLSAAGLGGGWRQGLFNLYYLSRRPVISGIDLQTFASYLPWPGVPQITSTPGSSPTPPTPSTPTP
jgi:peptidoglycan/xylan/chitin deacetylase (PgdA/CDA1 family)